MSRNSRILLRRIAVLLVVITRPLLSFAQQDSQQEFSVSVMEDTIYQGDSVHVVFTVIASKTKGFSYSSQDVRMEGGVMIGTPGYTFTDEGWAWKRTLTASFLVKGCGELAILPLKVSLGNEPVYSDTLMIDVLPDREYGAEWTVAYDFLLEQGVVSKGLTYRYGTETFKAFSDNDANSFVIVASSPYDQYLDNPILAFGIGNPMWNGVDNKKDNSVYHIMNRYDYQLKELRERHLVYKGLDMKQYMSSKEGAVPLMGDLCFDQSTPYNSQFPIEKWGEREVNCLTGCGPLALAEVLSYHHWGRAPKGYAAFSIYTGVEKMIDVAEYKFSWGGDNNDKASLIMCCAASVGANMSPWSTTSSLSDFKSALVNIWGYDPQCKWTYRGDYKELLRGIFSEIDASRPVIVADDNHIFVCDGYYDDYLHFNLGWKGYCNGFYRIIVLPTLQEWQLPFSETLTGIKPLNEQLDVELKVKKPGSLRNLLEDYDIMKITSLTLSGTIDGDDIQLIRCMAGAHVNRLYEDNSGSLMHLDLTETTIKGGKVYAIIKGDGVIIPRTGYDGSKKVFVDFELSDVSDADWADIVSKGDDKLYNMILERDPEGKVYVKCYENDDNVIAAHMFDGCENLVTLNLPKKSKRVDAYAFKNCRSLSELTNRPNKVTLNAYSNCRFLDLE